MSGLRAAERVAIARHGGRPGVAEYIEGLFTDFFEQRGDRQSREDPSILGGIALYRGKPVTVLGTRKGTTLEDHLKFNFGMPGPEGYRKALRIMKQAEKFGRPVVTFIDTSGAYPGMEAEARGQGEAIARNLFEMSRLQVPVVAVICGEAGICSGCGVATLSISYYEIGWMAGEMAAQILKGEKSVSELPIGFDTTLDKMYNPSICEQLGLTMPEGYAPIGG